MLYCKVCQTEDKYHVSIGHPCTADHGFQEDPRYVDCVCDSEAWGGDDVPVPCAGFSGNEDGSGLCLVCGHLSICHLVPAKVVALKKAQQLFPSVEHRYANDPVFRQSVDNLVATLASAHYEMLKELNVSDK